MGSTGSDTSALQDGDVLVEELERVACTVDSQVGNRLLLLGYN